VLLEFLVPSYKRKESLLGAIESIALQILENQFEGKVSVTITDDCSPNVTTEWLSDNFSKYSGFLNFSQNDSNKGMSCNIRDMVVSSQATFCTILTDDDQLQPNTLVEIVEKIEEIEMFDDSDDYASFYVPRFSYEEDGSLRCIACNSFDDDTVIDPGPLNSARYFQDGFILTGLFIRPQKINFEIWNKYLSNCYFPVIYFSDLLLKYKCLYINSNWFVHTVMNQCHWESWGNTEVARRERLFKDYMKAVTVACSIAFANTTSVLTKLCIYYQEYQSYKWRYSLQIMGINKATNVSSFTKDRVAFRAAKMLS